MLWLRERMAEYGFESNDDYGYAVMCLLAKRGDGLRGLNIEGESSRRNTAFAMALAQALGFLPGAEQRLNAGPPRILYHDFTQKNPPLPEVILPPSQDELGREEPPIDPLDQIVSEACAFSEADFTILILDQLQAVDFREHIRIYQFLRTARWLIRDAPYQASIERLLVFLISEVPLYHSLQKASFRVWVNRVSSRQVTYKPEDFGLPRDAQPVLDAFAALFRGLGMVPTFSEYRHLMRDMCLHIRTDNDLRDSLYGWTEGLSREQLFSEVLQAPIQRVVEAILTFVGCDEVILQALDRGHPVG
ncbi:conserved hypothetical protein [Gammaproteobacteria bacterium]